MQAFQTTRSPLFSSCLSVRSPRPGPSIRDSREQGSEEAGGGISSPFQVLAFFDFFFFSSRGPDRIIAPPPPAPPLSHSSSSSRVSPAQLSPFGPFLGGRGCTVINDTLYSSNHIYFSKNKKRFHSLFSSPSDKSPQKKRNPRRDSSSFFHGSILDIYIFVCISPSSSCCFPALLYT